MTMKLAGWSSDADRWDPWTGQNLGTLEGHEEKINSLEFSPDGARIVTSSMDHQARLWTASGVFERTA